MLRNISVIFLLHSFIYTLYNIAGLSGSDVHLTGDQEVAGLTPTEVGNILSWKLIVKYFLFSMVILSLPLIQEG